MSSVDRAAYELLERYGFDTSHPMTKHRKHAIVWIGSLPLTHAGKAELTEFVLSERFLDV